MKRTCLRDQHTAAVYHTPRDTRNSLPGFETVSRFDKHHDLV